MNHVAISSQFDRTFLPWRHKGQNIVSTDENHDLSRVRSNGIRKPLKGVVGKVSSNAEIAQDAAPSVAGPTVRGPSVAGTDLDAHGRHRPLQADVRSCRSVPSVSSWRGLDRQIVERTRCGAQPGSETCRYRDVVSRSRWPSSSWMLRRSVPASSRCVANEWRRTCGLSGFLIPSCLRSFWHTTRTAFAFSGSPGRFPLKQPVLGLAPPPVHAAGSPAASETA